MEFVTRYRRPSTVDAQTGLMLVFLATNQQAQQPVPQLFTGSIAEPVMFRNLLLGLKQTVESRFHRPDWWRLVDPVITSGRRTLRLECFSSCASVYARADFSENAFADGAFHGEGTTNVDFNSAFVNHLAALRPGKTAQFEMGEESVKLATYRGQAVEHKVRLPERWLKGFLQVQAVQRRAEPLFELSRMSARQLLALLPTSGNDTFYIVPGRAKPALLYRPPPGAHVAVNGGQRLRLLKPLMPHIEALRIYQNHDTGASVWIADTGAGRFTLGLSSAVSHGFSGDGDALRQLSAPGVDDADLVFARAAAESLNHFSVEELAAHQDLDAATAAEIVDRLAIQGLLGYDRDRAVYYYRQLPFVARDVHTPARLKNASALLGQAALEVEQVERDARGLVAQGWVRGSNGDYRVRLAVDQAGYLQSGECGCAWVQQHGLARGPCKHLLALRFAAEART